MKNGKKRLLILVTVIFSAYTIYLSFYYSNLTGGTDLRNRVVGSRLMERSYSPYFYKWQSKDGERLLDPNNQPARLANGNTVTPAVFYLMRPFNHLTYPSIRLLWTIILLCAEFIVLFMMIERHPGENKIETLAIVVVGLFCSNYWLMQVERGQMMILYVLFFVFMYFTYTSKWKKAEFISGVIGGLFIFFRPYALIAVLGFLLSGKIKWLKGYVFGFLIGCLVFIVPNPAVWKDYLNAMKEYGNECLGKGHTVSTPISEPIPTVIEGATNLTFVHHFNLDNMPAMYGYIRKLGIDYTFLISIAVCVAINSALSFFFFRLGIKSSPINIFLFAFLNYLVAELFLLNWRDPYNIVEWTFPLFLLMYKLEKVNIGVMLLLFSLLLLHYFPFPFHYQTLIGESLLIMLLVYSIFNEPIDRSFKIN